MGSKSVSLQHYSSPVDALLTYGEPEIDENWSRYLELGFTSEHIPQLIEIVLDEALYLRDDSATWAPVHAWRTLGALHAEAAIAPLIQVIQRWGDDSHQGWWEWIIEELPEVFSRIGEATIPELAAYLADSTQPEACRGIAVTCIEKIGSDRSEYREACVAALTQQLEHFNENPPVLNGELVGALAAGFQAVESAAVIEQAFQAERVDTAFVGDWDETQVYLGLKSREEVPRRNFFTRFQNLQNIEPVPMGFAAERSASTKAKAKRKAQKQARRKNRPKKKK